MRVELKVGMTYQKVTSVRSTPNRCLARLKTDLELYNSKEFAVYYGNKLIDVYCHLELDHSGVHQAICFAREDAMWFAEWQDENELDEI